MNYSIKNIRPSMLNIGCGSKAHKDWNNIDFSPIIFFVRHPKISILLNKIGFLSTERLSRIVKIDPQIINFNIGKNKKLPFKKDSFDVIYHSHFLEHLDRHTAKVVLSECHRCLNDTGIVRIVVPDLLILCERYCQSYQLLKSGDQSKEEIHNLNINELLHQMVNSETYGSSLQIPVVRAIEKIIRGDAKKAGEQHLWMYDEFSLASLLKSVGFYNIQIKNYKESNIENWASYKLDINEDGTQYMKNSIYIEAFKSEAL